MYQHKVTAYGSFAQHTLFDAATGDAFSFLPGHGAMLTNLMLNGREVLDGYTTVAAVKADRWSKSRLLYPFPNRLQGGSYTWQGQTYQFPLNDDKRQNALHGFPSDRKFNVLPADTAEQTGQLVCEMVYKGDLSYYPFPFTVRVTYRLVAPHAFQLDLSLTNTGTTAIPVGLGWHPYFCLTPTVGDTHLHLPPVELIGVDAAMIPTGKRYAYTQFAQEQRIGEEVLDNGFALVAPEGRAQVVLRGAGATLTYWQETGAGKFNFLQVFTPAHRRSIAIEPMTCNIDTFHNGDGLVVLEPGGSVGGRCGGSLVRSL